MFITSPGTSRMLKLSPVTSRMSNIYSISRYIQVFQSSPSTSRMFIASQGTSRLFISSPSTPRMFITSTGSSRVIHSISRYTKEFISRIIIISPWFFFLQKQRFSVGWWCLVHQRNITCQISFLTSVRCIDFCFKGAAQKKKYIHIGHIR